MKLDDIVLLEKGFTVLMSDDRGERQFSLAYDSIDQMDLGTFHPDAEEGDDPVSVRFLLVGEESKDLTGKGIYRWTCHLEANDENFDLISKVESLYENWLDWRLG